MMTEKKRFTLKGLIEAVPNICDNGEIMEQEDVVDKLNEMDSRIQELEKENQRLNAKVNRLTDELANCYEKLGW